MPEIVTRAAVTAVVGTAEAATEAATEVAMAGAAVEAAKLAIHAAALDTCPEIALKGRNATTVSFAKDPLLRKLTSHRR